jgi:hydrogenase expression/formation protein HypE
MRPVANNGCDSRLNVLFSGAPRPDVQIGGAQAKPGDVVNLSGPSGDHEIAVLGTCGEQDFEAAMENEAAPLNHPIAVMLAACNQIHILRDPTHRKLPQNT